MAHHHQSVAELLDLNSREVQLIYIYRMGDGMNESSVRWEQKLIT